MGLVQRIPFDPVVDIYRQLRQLRTDINRLGSRGTTFPIQTPTGQTFNFTPGDGTNWIDSSDGSLHYMLGGIEYKLVGTVV